MKSVPDEKPDRAAGLVSSFPVANLGGICGARIKLLRYNPSGRRIANSWTFDAIFIPIGA